MLANSEELAKMSVVEQLSISNHIRGRVWTRTTCSVLEILRETSE
jgi:hypothetical protein